MERRFSGRDRQFHFFCFFLAESLIAYVMSQNRPQTVRYTYANFSLEPSPDGTTCYHDIYIVPLDMKVLPVTLQSGRHTLSRSRHNIIHRVTLYKYSIWAIPWSYSTLFFKHHQKSPLGMSVNRSDNCHTLPVACLCSCNLLNTAQQTWDPMVA